MLKRVIDVALAYRWFVVLGIFVLFAVGGYALYTLPVEAFPDLTNNQVTVVTEAPSMPPTEVEQLVTYPIEQAMMGMPKQQEVRSLSELGLSMITIVFDDSVPMYFARQLVNERLQQITSQLPNGIQPVLGLPATAFGELYQYTLSGPMSPMALKDLQEWQIKRQLRMVPGVSEVKQYQITVDPALLAQYGLTLNDVAQRVEANNHNFGGGFVEHNDEQYTLRGAGRAESTEDLGNIVLLAHRGTAVLLRDVAQVAIGPAPRHGAVLRNGETVSGMVIMLKSENGKRVIQAIKQRIAEMHLPPGVKISPFYDQSSVIDGTIQTVKKNLFEGFLLVTVVLFLFLGNVRAALITASVIPLAMLVSFINMRVFGVSANLMSLGAIDFGMVVDGAVVMMENAIHRLEQGPPAESPIETIRSAASEVARPMVFGIVIIIAVYIPIFFLEGLEGRMFRPMAFTVCSALFGSLFLALIAIPSLASLAFPKGLPAHYQSSRQRWMDKMSRHYVGMLEAVLRHRRLALVAALAVLAVALASLAFIGTEFMPRLDEGSILLETRKLPGISLTDSVEISRRIEKTLRTFPEIADVTIKIGRPDFATEAMGINEGDTYLALRPAREWTRFHSKAELIDALDKELSKIPGLNFDFTQPMAMRVDETVSGVKADLAIKIFGDDFATLNNLAQQVVRIVGSVRGSADPQIELTSGVAELAVRVRQDQLARYGLNVKDVEQAVEAGASGANISEIIEGQKRYSVALKLPAGYRRDPEAMRDILLHAPDGEQVTLGQVANVSVTRAAQGN
jgi:heavy metal efflux system protein